MGSGNAQINGPDYLLAADVVLVTFNYRLGALGKGHFLPRTRQRLTERHKVHDSALHISDK